MKISVRNRIKGVVKEIEKGEVASTVKIEVSKRNKGKQIVKRGGFYDLPFIGIKIHYIFMLMGGPHGS